MVVFASGELKEIRECCNFVYNLQAHIVFFMCDMRYNCVVRFSMVTGGEKDVYVFCE